MHAGAAEGRNLAGSGARAYASSQYSPHTGPAKAVDGVLDTWAPNLFQSAPASTAVTAAAARGELVDWLAVRLAAGAVNDPLVVLYARDCCTVDFGGRLDLYIGSSSPSGQDAALADAVLCGTILVGDGGRQTARCSGSGDTVFVATAERLAGGSLSIAELQVFGADAADSNRIVVRRWPHPSPPCVPTS